MRIISGSARGLKLATLEGTETRPTLDRVKEPLFSIIQAQIKDARVLDLFAGSGALGLESLSRGAQSAVFTDISKRAVEVISQNIKKMKFEEKSVVLNQSYEKTLKELSSEKKEFDLIFLDPPYASGLLENAIQEIISYNLLSREGIIIVETDMESELQKVQNIGLHIKDIRKYGRVILLMLGHSMS